MGLIVLDADVLIPALDASDAHHAGAVAALREARGRGDHLIVPASAYAEALVGPSRGGTDKVAVVDAFLVGLASVVEPASRAIARSAAALRAAHGRNLRLPDALVLATASVLVADLVVTTGASWPATQLVVRVLAPPQTGSRSRASGTSRLVGQGDGVADDAQPDGLYQWELVADLFDPPGWRGALAIIPTAN